MDVVNFLAELHQDGYQYRSLNAYRSAISSAHEKVDGCNIGEHPMVSRLLKGAFNVHPPLPKYCQTWSVKSVLEHIESYGTQNHQLSLVQLTYKTVMLLALTRPSRSADLVSLDISRRSFTPLGVTFHPTSLAKQSRQGKQIKDFFFPVFDENKAVCPVETLRAYEERTKPIRGTETKLFISIIKPHKSVSSSTVARWLKKLLEEAGVDIGTFSAHSVRGASSSTASNMGVTTNDILEAADWSSSSVFEKFYYKPTHDSAYGKAVLSSANKPVSKK